MFLGKYKREKSRMVGPTKSHTKGGAGGEGGGVEGDVEGRIAISECQIV